MSKVGDKLFKGQVSEKERKILREAARRYLLRKVIKQTTK